MLLVGPTALDLSSPLMTDTLNFSPQLIIPYHIPRHHGSTSNTSLVTTPLLITTHHIFATHGPLFFTTPTSHKVLITALLLLFTTSHRSTSDMLTSHHSSSQLNTSHVIKAAASSFIKPHHNLSQSNSWQLNHLLITTSRHNPPQLITSQLSTAPLSHPFSHSTYHTPLLIRPRSLHLPWV